MDEEPERAADDPEIAALLDFAPVPRKQLRANGWSPERQRIFISFLAETGDYRAAAEAVALSWNSAYQLRKEPGAEDFLRAWEDAVALYHRRNGIVPRHGAAPRRAHEADPSQAEADAHWQTLCDTIFAKYLMKLCQEREARLKGCIVEADFYARQLFWLEVALDLGGLGDKAVVTLKRLKRGDLDAGRIAATPVSLLLDHLRRAMWAKFGEPERPPPPALGLHPGADASTGGWSENRSPRPSEAELALRAEAQALWEEKARADAAAWRARLGLPPLEDEEDRTAPGDEDEA